MSGDLDLFLLKDFSPWLLSSSGSGGNGMDGGGEVVVGRVRGG